jgi:hypothetical protein
MLPLGEIITLTTVFLVQYSSAAVGYFLLQSRIILKKTVDRLTCYDHN